jgi:hypothetical protein
MPIVRLPAQPQPQAGVASTCPLSPDIAALVEDLADDTYVLSGEDGLDIVLSPREPDHQRLWLNMVEARVPAACDLADRLLVVLRRAGISVIRLTEPVRLALMRDARDDEVQLDALIGAKLAAVHVRHFLASEIVLVLSEGPGDSLPG